MASVRRTTQGERRTVNAALSSSVVRHWSLLALVLALAIFLTLALHQLYLPGLYYDEALDLAPMLQVMHGEPTELLRGIGVRIGEHTYPVMLMDYMGSLNGYLTLPFMALFGPGVVAARLEPILFSALTIVLSYALARAWFGRGVAAVTALLLAVNPSFIWFSRQGISVTSAMTVFSLGSLLLLERWRVGVREIGDWRLEIKTFSRIPNLQSLISNLPLLCAGLLLGLGLWAKLLFLWWIIIIAVIGLVWLLTQRRADTEIHREKGRLGITLSPPLPLSLSPLLVVLRALPWVAVGFVIGAAPLIYFNLNDLLRQPFDLRNAHTLALLLKSLSQPTEYGVNNLNLVENLKKALIDFNVFLDGSYFWYNGVPFSNVYALPSFVLSVIIGSVLSVRRTEWRKWVAILAAIAVTVFISAFTVSGLWATHLFILLPLPQIVVATAAVWLASKLAPQLPRSLAPLLLLILLALPFSRDLWVSQQHHAQLAQSGGSGRFSDAVYKLAAYLDAAQVDSPVALDWGIEKSVRVLTADRVRPVEIFGYTPEPDEAFKARAREALRDPTRQYIVLWDRFAVYNRRKAFTEIAKDMGLQVTETFIAHERSGLPVYVVLQAR